MSEFQSMVVDNHIQVKGRNAIIIKSKVQVLSPCNHPKHSNSVENCSRLWFKKKKKRKIRNPNWNGKLKKRERGEDPVEDGANDVVLKRPNPLPPNVLVLLRERNFMGFIYAMKFLFLFFKLWLFFSQTNVGFCFDVFLFFYSLFGFSHWHPLSM